MIHPLSVNNADMHLTTLAREYLLPPSETPRKYTRTSDWIKHTSRDIFEQFT